MLDTQQLADMTACVTASLPETVSVRRNTPTSDGQGGTTDSWAEAFTVAARRDDLSRTDEQLIASKLDAVTAYAVLLPAGTPVKQSDRLYFASDSLTLEIVGFGHRSWELCHRCLCVEVAGS